MAKTQYYTATSIDGYIADPENSFDWLFEAASGRDGSPFESFFTDVGAFAMGATTYEWYWNTSRCSTTLTSGHRSTATFRPGSSPIAPYQSSLGRG